jgi:exopolysaccharide production protein ExoQ
MTSSATVERVRAPAIVLTVAAVVAPTLAVLAPLGVAPLLTVVAVALLIAAPRRLWDAARSVWPFAALWGALAVYGMLSATWSIIPQHSLIESARFLAIGVEGTIALAAARTLSPRDAARVGQFAAIGVALGAGLLLFEWASDGATARWLHGWSPTTLINEARYDRGATTAVLIVWPAALALRRWRILQLAIGVLVAASVYLMVSTASLLALIVGFAGFVVALRWPRLIAGALAAGIVLGAALLPVVVPSYQTTVQIRHAAPWIKISGIHRLLIWRFAGNRIADRPLLGWGLDSSRAMPGGNRDFGTTLPGIELGPGHTAMPLHPHDALLQWRLELGIPGTLLGLALVLWTLYRVGWKFGGSREVQATALGWGAAVTVIALLSFGIWQEWWLSCILFTASLLAASAIDAG